MKNLNLYKIGLIFLYFIVILIQCQSNYNSLELNTFQLNKKILDESQPILYGNAPTTGLSLTSKSLEKVTGISQHLSCIEFISLKVSHASDSIITGLRAKNNYGDEIYYFDTNNDENFMNESPLKMVNVGMEPVLTVSLQFDELNKKKTVKCEVILEIIKRKRLEYFIKNYWQGKIIANKDTLQIAVLRIFPDYSFMFIDSDKDGIYNKYFDIKSERIALGGMFYKIQIDITSEEIKLLETSEQPVDVGYPAPLFVGKIWKSERYFNLSEERGKVTVLFFSYADCHGTPACMPSLIDMNKEFANNKNINFISISKDSIDVKKYHNRFDFPFLSIIDKNTWEKYGVIVTPTTFLIDKEGIILQRIVGDHNVGKILNAKISNIFNR